MWAKRSLPYSSSPPPLPLRSMIRFGVFFSARERNVSVQEFRIPWPRLVRIVAEPPDRQNGRRSLEGQLVGRAALGRRRVSLREEPDDVARRDARYRDLLGLPALERPEADPAGFPPPEPKGQEPAESGRILEAPEPAGPDPGVARNEREERRDDVPDRRPVDGQEFRAFLDARVRAQVPEDVGLVLQEAEPKGKEDGLGVEVGAGRRRKHQTRVPVLDLGDERQEPGVEIEFRQRTGQSVPGGIEALLKRVRRRIAIEPAVSFLQHVPEDLEVFLERFDRIGLPRVERVPGLREGDGDEDGHKRSRDRDGRTGPHHRGPVRLVHFLSSASWFPAGFVSTALYDRLSILVHSSLSTSAC